MIVVPALIFFPLLSKKFGTTKVLQGCRLAATQTAATNGAMIFLYSILPMILFVVMFILSMMCKVDSTRPQMEADLVTLHGEKE